MNFLQCLFHFWKQLEVTKSERGECPNKGMRLFLIWGRTHKSYHKSSIFSSTFPPCWLELLCWISHSQPWHRQKRSAYSSVLTWSFALFSFVDIGGILNCLFQFLGNQRAILFVWQEYPVTRCQDKIWNRFGGQFVERNLSKSAKHESGSRKFSIVLRIAVTGIKLITLKSECFEFNLD